MRHHISLPMIALVALTLAGAAAADSITYSGYLDFNSAGSGTIYVSQFDPSLGTLTGVTVRIYQSSQASFAVDNDDVLDRTAQAQMYRYWNLSGGAVTDSATDLFTSSTIILSADNGDGSGTADYTTPDGFNWGMVTGGGLHSTNVITSGDWATYTGTGSVAYNVNMTMLVNSINTNSNSYQSQVINGTPANQRFLIYVDYEYDYEYVPEPGTMALLSLGIAGFGIWRRRRSS